MADDGATCRRRPLQKETQELDPDDDDESDTGEMSGRTRMFGMTFGILAVSGYFGSALNWRLDGAPQHLPLLSELHLSLAVCAAHCAQVEPANWQYLDAKLQNIQRSHPRFVAHTGTSKREHVCMMDCVSGNVGNLDKTLQQVDEAAIERRKAAVRVVGELVACASTCRASSPLPADASVAEAMEQLRRCGWLELKDAFPEGSLAGIRQELGDSAALAPLTNQSHLGQGRSEVFLPFQPPFSKLFEAAAPQIKAVFKQYLGSEDLALDHASAIIAQPGAPPQDIHRDVAFGAASRSFLTVEAHLSDLRAEEGPTAFCACTHRPSTDPLVDYIVQIAQTFPRIVAGGPSKGKCAIEGSPSHSKVTSAGSAVIYDGLTSRLGLRNSTEGQRAVATLSLAKSREQVVSHGYERHFPAAAVAHQQAWRDAFASGKVMGNSKPPEADA